MMKLKDTVAFMDSRNYKERFIGEYLQTAIRHRKLVRMIEKLSAGELGFEPKCPYEVLMNQILAMANYLRLMEKRAEYEEIDLTEWKEQIR